MSQDNDRLKESEAKFRTFVEKSSDIIFTVTEEGIFDYASPNWKDLLGHDTSEVTGRTPADFTPEEDAKKCFEYLKRTLQGEEMPEGVEYRVYHKDGNVKWHATKGSIIKGDSGEKKFIGVARDITRRKEIEESLNHQLRFQKMVSDISSFFVRLPTHQLEEGINHALKLIGEFFQVDRSYVFQFSDDGQTMSNTFEWCADGIEPQKDKIQDFPVSNLPWIVEQIRTKDYVHIPDVENLLPEAEKRELKSQGIQSLLCIPMIKNIEVIGFLGFDAVREKKAWTESQITLLKVVAELISSTLSKSQIEEKIRYLSFHDKLTGLYNRTYLEEEMKRLDTKRQLPISIIMTDLNGLKLVNDTFGHCKGDEMLQHASNILKNSCRSEDIIARWGGDEFIIFLPRTTKEEAWTICKRIKNRCSEYYVKDVPVSMATGAASKDNTETNLSEVLKEAENNMYKHKLGESQSARNAVINNLLKTLEEKSYETKAHTRRMQTFAYDIGEKIDLNDLELSRLHLLITLHDIGKINITKEILTKKDYLTYDEWIIIKKHPEIGYRIARASDDFAHVAEDILAHHEHWEGTGYPRGLKGKEIPLLARIVSIADAYEVMTSGRPYKKAMPQREVVAELKRCAGTQFDPELVDIFLSVLKN